MQDNKMTGTARTLEGQSASSFRRDRKKAMHRPTQNVR